MIKKIAAATRTPVTMFCQVMLVRLGPWIDAGTEPDRRRRAEQPRSG